MALLSFKPLPCLSSSTILSHSTSLPIVVLPISRFPIAVLPISRLRLKTSDFPHSKCFTGTQFVPDEKTLSRNVKVYSAITDGEAQPEETKKEALPVDKLPMESKESKVQQLMEAKLRMKLAKKIRLRRKRLVRKRKLRKKGRWPPSKMKKLKNV